MSVSVVSQRLTAASTDVLEKVCSHHPRPVRTAPSPLQQAWTEQDAGEEWIHFLLLMWDVHLLPLESKPFFLRPSESGLILPLHFHIFGYSHPFCWDLWTQEEPPLQLLWLSREKRYFMGFFWFYICSWAKSPVHLLFPYLYVLFILCMEKSDQ